MSQQTMDQNNFLEDDETNALSAFQEKLRDAMTPGVQIEFDPNEAATAGAFFEDALSEQDATESDIDLLDAMTLNEESRD